MTENGLPQSGEFYKDKADGLYQVLLTAVNAIDRGSMVVYQELKGTYPVCVIPAELFLAGFARVILKREGEDALQPQNTARQTAVSEAEESGKQNLCSAEMTDAAAETERLAGTESRTDTRTPAAADNPAGADSRTAEETPADTKNRTAAGSPAGCEERSYADGSGRRSAGLENRIHSGLMDFLDARTYQEKLEILDGMRSSLNERVLNDIGMSLDISVEDKKTEEKYLVIRNYLKTQIRFEDRRLR